MSRPGPKPRARGLGGQETLRLVDVENAFKAKHSAKEWDRFLHEVQHQQALRLLDENSQELKRNAAAREACNRNTLAGAAEAMRYHTRDTELLREREQLMMEAFPSSSAEGHG